MRTQYDEIINSFVDKYGLTRGQVIAEIEKTFSVMLSTWHQTNMVVFFGDDQLRAIKYIQEYGVQSQYLVDLVIMRGWNTIRRTIDKSLTQASCLHDVAHYKRMEHELRWGDIIRKNESGVLVEIEIVDGCPIIAECPLNRVGVHERSGLSVGQRRAFHLRRVDPVTLRGITRVQVTVDRVSKNLVTTLLKENLGTVKDINIYCSKRYVGHKSFVEASEFIPKEAIKAASKELQEHIQVAVVRGESGSTKR